MNGGRGGGWGVAAFVENSFASAGSFVLIVLRQMRLRVFGVWNRKWLINMYVYIFVWSLSLYFSLCPLHASPVRATPTPSGKGVLIIML